MFLDNTDMKNLMGVIESAATLQQTDKKSQASKPADILDHFNRKRFEKINPPKSPKNLGWGRMSER